MAKRKTLEECKELVNARGGEILKLHEDFRGLSTKVDIACSQCGEAMTTTIGAYLKKKYTICSTCMIKNNKEINKEMNRKLGIGEDEVFVGYEISSKGVSVMSEKREPKKSESELQREWADAVKENANYVCDCCGKSGNMVAHHLNGYNWCKDQRHNVENGVCLCEECHKKFHKLYGYGNNTKREYVHFKESKAYKGMRYLSGKVKKEAEELVREANSEVMNSYIVRF